MDGTCSRCPIDNTSVIDFEPGGTFPCPAECWAHGVGYVYVHAGLGGWTGTARDPAPKTGPGFP